MAQQKRPLALLDNAFLLTENAEAPKHISSLFLYQTPAGASNDYVYQLYSQWLQSEGASAPFNWKLSGINPLRPSWVADTNFQISRHLRYHRLPENSGHKELLTLVGELHEQPLKRDRPLWSIHIIDDLADGGFAMYLSIHHALIDGMTAVHLIKRAHDSKPLAGNVPFWQRQYPEFQLSAKSWLAQQQDMLSGGIDATQRGAKNLLGLGQLSMQLLKEAVGINDTPLTMPFSAKSSVLNGETSSQRSIATATLPLDQVKRVCEKTKASLNHVVLTCIDEAMHRYLEDIDAALDAPLHVSIPVSLRGKEGEQGQAGNSVAALPVTLADAHSSLPDRLTQIGKSLTGLRELVKSNTNSSLETYSLVTGIVAQSLETTSTQSLAPGASHFLVSNVPGPTHTLYQGEAPLLEWFPVSNLYPGQRINITLISYDGKLCLGVVASAEFLPEVELLAQQLEQAFAKLVRHYLPQQAKRKKAAA